MTSLSERVLVVVPTYNEIDNVRQIVARVRAAVPEVDVLVVDDNSPDGTGAAADDLVAEDTQVNVLHRETKTGLGAAYVAGFGWGIERGYDVLVEMDADGSHAPEQLPRLLTALDGADIVLGSRWVPGGAVVNWPASRKMISRSGSRYARFALGLDIRDATGGYRAIRRDVLEGIDYRNAQGAGYCFQVELAWRAVRAGYRLVEVPITFVERERGESKMSGAIVREAFVRVTTWGFKERFRQFDNAKLR